MVDFYRLLIHFPRSWHIYLSQGVCFLLGWLPQWKVPSLRQKLDPECWEPNWYLSWVPRLDMAGYHPSAEIFDTNRVTSKWWWHLLKLAITIFPNKIIVGYRFVVSVSGCFFQQCCVDVWLEWHSENEKVWGIQVFWHGFSFLMFWILKFFALGTSPTDNKLPASRLKMKRPKLTKSHLKQFLFFFRAGTPKMVFFFGRPSLYYFF